MSHRTRRALWTALPAAVLLLAGCTQTHLLIEMTPRGAGLERRVSVYRLDDGDSTDTWKSPWLSGADSARLEATYGVRPDTAQPYVAMRRFDDVPADVGNWGSWTCITTPLGSTTTYLERVRGDATPGATLAARFAAADSLAALLGAWAATGGVEPARWPRLAGYLERDLGRDLRDMVARTWVGEAAADSAADVRSTVDQDEHPVPWSLAFMTWQPRSRAVLLGPAPDATASALRRELFDALESTLAAPPGARERHAIAATLDSVRIRLGLRSDVFHAPPPADSLRWDRLHARLGVMSSPDGGVAVVEVRLALGEEPDDTNGSWDAVHRRVVWTGAVSSPGGPGLPLVCRAVWAQPDSARQFALFGRVVIRGSALSDYAPWYEALASRRRVEWDRALASFGHGDLRRLQGFHFADEARAAAHADSTWHSAAEFGCTVLQRGSTAER